MGISAKGDPSLRVALVMCLLPAFYFFVALVFALMHFKDYGSDVPQFLRYVAVPALVLIFLCVVPTMFSRSVAASIGLTALAILLGLFAIEIWLTVKLIIILVGMVGGIASVDTGKFDGLPPSAGLGTVNREIGTNRLAEAVLSGIPLSKVFFCNNGDKTVTYTADRNGFNNPDQVYDDIVELVVVGDSFVEGFCLDSGTEVLGQLRKTHPRTVGLALRGSGPLFELAMLKRFGTALQPKTTVIVFFEGNDWENLENELELNWLTKSLEPNADFGPANMSEGQLEKMRLFVSAYHKKRIPTYDVFIKKSTLRNFLALHQTFSILGLSYPKVAQPQAEYLHVLKRAQDVVSEWNGKLKLVYLPQADRYSGLLNRNHAYDSTRALVLIAARQAGVDVIDLTDKFWRTNDPAGLYADDAHLSERGAAEMARVLAGELDSHGAKLSGVGP